ncbi:hypothetical protein Ddye_019677 [Dipteronia dyeriana]|uniref:Uncharacterized protein n=1 Tax=Dipteronia dyeriana TaxID=168575 RepID=A0AAD9TYJ1_9ROSI|nr:hypothetical protein Ddye_019677 [Dipteronia dyeriana]
MDVIDVDAPNLLSFSFECQDFLYLCSIKGSRRCPCKLKFLIKPDTEGDILVLTWFSIIKEEFIGVAHQVKELSMSINIMIPLFFYEMMINRDTKCCNSHIIKCWRHYLKDFKIESFVPYKDPEPLHVDNLIAELPGLPDGTIRFHLDWCFFLHIDEA